MRIFVYPRFVIAMGAALLACVAPLACAAPRSTSGAAEPAPNVETSRPAESSHQEVSVVSVDSLRLSLSIVGTAPRAGDPITLELIVLNEASSEAVIDFANGQRYDFEILGTDGSVSWHWAEDMFFTMALGREVVAHGETLRWQETFAAGLPAGSYRVVGTLASMERESVELVLTIEG